MRTSYPWSGVLVALLTLFFIGSADIAEAQRIKFEETMEPSVGVVPQRWATRDTAPTSSILTPTVNETGLLSLSIDGCGTASASCTVDVLKPAGATVRGAYLAASTNFGFVIPNGFVTLAGTPIDWDAQVSTNAGSTPNFFSSHFDDVTSIVAPIINAAAAGTTSLTVTGGSNDSIDGVSLVVIFDDPSETTTSSVIIAFGGQATTGDTFNIGLAEPFNDATQDITLSLAIGFSNQAGNQFSLVDVNGTRMTSSAGDFDDGAIANGALYTVGGLGDSPANPVNPASNTDPDDELYTLDPFIPNGATNVTVFSSNPSNDDIIHLATFQIRGTAAIVGEGILLTPLTATNPVGTNHTVTALVQDDDGNPITGRNVDFSIQSGPNAGLTGSDVTDASGEATFTWSSAVAGTDVVVASFLNNQQQTVSSNTASKTWEAGSGDQTPPVCGAIVPEFNGPGGALSAVQSSASDLESGIASVLFIDLRNMSGFADGNGPFAQGDLYTDASNPASVTLRGERISLATGGGIIVTVTNGAGLTAQCDPVAAQPGASPDTYALDAPHPNPTSGVTAVRFSVPERTQVRVAVYDVTGREVAVLADETMAAGMYTATWSGADEAGRSLAAGVYVVRMVTRDFVATQRLTLVH